MPKSLISKGLNVPHRCENCYSYADSKYIDSVSQIDRELSTDLIQTLLSKVSI